MFIEIHFMVKILL